MSCNNDAYILKALRTLCDVSPEAFRRHRAETLLAFQKLQKFVTDDCSTESRIPLAQSPYSNSSSRGQNGVSSPSSDTETSSLLWSGGPGLLASSPDCEGLILPLTTAVGASTLRVNLQKPGTPSTHQVPESSRTDDSIKTLNSSTTKELMQALDKAKDSIKEYLSRSEVEATRDVLQRRVEDPRVVDLKLGKKPSPEATFRKGLGQRSLALEFEQWELCVHKSSKVTELVKDLSLSQERRHGHIREYLQSNTHRFQDRATTGKGIEHGIKLLVFERMFGARVISGILSFIYRRFRAVRYEELALLQGMMRHSQWLAELASSKAAWFDRCQGQYEGT